MENLSKVSKNSPKSGSSPQLSEVKHEIAAGDSDLLGDQNERANDTSTAEIKKLRSKLAGLQSRYTTLIFENEKTNIDLAHEKRKVVQLERQLQFFKDNQVVFENLRKTYVNINCNESPRRKLVEIRDKGVQTWEGVLCRACLDTEKIRSELERTTAEYNNCLLVKRDEMDQISDMVRKLKNHVNNEIISTEEIAEIDREKDPE